MFAIIETGGKQYKVSEGKTLKIEKIPAGADGKVVFDNVLLTADGNDVALGTPYLSGVLVEGEMVREGKGKKKLVFRYHSKTRYRKKKGHRQVYTEVKIIKIRHE